jgi:hypothetical protein
MTGKQPVLLHADSGGKFPFLQANCPYPVALAGFAALQTVNGRLGYEGQQWHIAAIRRFLSTNGRRTHKKFQHHCPH